VSLNVRHEDRNTEYDFVGYLSLWCKHDS